MLDHVTSVCAETESPPFAIEHPHVEHSNMYTPSQNRNSMGPLNAEDTEDKLNSHSTVPNLLLKWFPNNLELMMKHQTLVKRN